MRTYEGWWFFSNETKAVQEELEWIPFRTYDNDRLEQALEDVSMRELPDELVVYDSSGQRMSKVNVTTMTMCPIYWSGPPIAVRRVVWMQMKDDEDSHGGIPVVPEWDPILEAAYQDNLEWLRAPTSEEVVEKIVGLGDSLAPFVLILRQGYPETATVTPRARLDEKPIFGKTESIRLIRGYTPYHIAVVSALKMAEGNKGGAGNSVALKPLILPSPFDPPDLSRPNAPSQLLFVVHGIGQKLAGKVGAGFLKDCSFLRERVQYATNVREGNPEDIYILPVCWRDGLQLGMKTYFEDISEVEDTFEDLVSRVTLANIPAIRGVATDVGLDILLYMTPAYFLRIIERTLSEVRRLYSIYLATGGEGAQTTTISFVGHSLGSAIVNDLLSFIVTSSESIDDAAKAVSSNLGFTVDRFFAIGSPLPMMFLLKQLKPIGCVPNIHKLGLDSVAPRRSAYPSVPEPDTSNDSPRKFVFACREVYNIFHPYDPLAYRLEPLIVPPAEMARLTYPVRLPYNKRGALHLKRQMEEGVQEIRSKANKAKDELVNSLTKSMSSLPEWLRPRIASPEAPKALEETVEKPTPLGVNAGLIKFNHHGRVDYSIEESLFENSYVSAIRSHFSYWDDIDIASFLAVELLSLTPKPSSGTL
ncbi:hypothetical protein PSACC_03530 [Paramicrosporidium saccamoebae]|uniref:DDHD domain-containing protein n=1 Tax=Paramicrosporidium saccamoebae TaxID=1246581 RepID=A0A2H9TFU2_9FUNG|nr:hypothetical protein PSACC_03530 [Paramicrosporidium saccamoebae]